MSWARCTAAGCGKEIQWSGTRGAALARLRSPCHAAPMKAARTGVATTKGRKFVHCAGCGRRCSRPARFELRVLARLFSASPVAIPPAAPLCRRCDAVALPTPCPHCSTALWSRSEASMRSWYGPDGHRVPTKPIAPLPAEGFVCTLHCPVCRGQLPRETANAATEEA